MAKFPLSYEVKLRDSNNPRNLYIVNVAALSWDKAAEQAEKVLKNDGIVSIAHEIKRKW